MIARGDKHRAKASRILKRDKRDAVTLAKVMHDAAKELLGAVGCYADAGMGELVQASKRCREEVLWIEDRARALARQGGRE